MGMFLTLQLCLDNDNNAAAYKWQQQAAMTWPKYMQTPSLAVLGAKHKCSCLRWSPSSCIYAACRRSAGRAAASTRSAPKAMRIYLFAKCSMACDRRDWLGCLGVS